MVINDYRQATVRSDLNRITISFGEILYYTGLVLWLMQFYITRTIYADFYSGKLMTAVRYFCMLIFMVKILLTEKSVNRRVIEVILAAAAVFIVVQRNVNTGMPLIQVLLLIYGAKDISFRKICKVMLWTCIALWSIPVLIDRIGIYSVSRQVYRERVREYLNFNYVSFPAIYFNNIPYCCMFAYTDPDRRGAGGSYAKRREVPWLVLIFFTALQIWLYINTDTSLPFLIGLLFLFLYTVVIKLRIFELRNSKINRLLSVVLFPAAAAASYWLCLEYGKKKPLIKMLDQMTHNRISLAYKGITRYGVHLFGIQIVENTDSTKGSYFYIDSGYIKNLLNYGLIVLIMILVYYSVILYAAIIERDKVLAIWLICIAVYSMFNNLLLSPAENGSLLAIWYALDLIKWHRQKEGVRRRDKRKRIEYAAES